MPTNFNFLKGFLFYQNIVRKSLINKFIFSSEKDVPNITGVNLSFLTNQKKYPTSDTALFSVLSVFEFLTGNAAVVKRCDEVKLDHFTKLRNVKINSGVFDFKKYEFFFNMHCLWFQGLHKISETYKTYNKHKTKFEKTKVEYLRYNEPVYSKKIQKSIGEEGSFFRSVDWKDFTFCTFIPVELTNSLMQQNIKIQLSFSTKKAKHIDMLLSSLSFHHKIKKINEI